MVFGKRADEIHKKLQELHDDFSDRHNALISLLAKAHETYDNRFNALEIEFQQLSGHFASEAHKVAEHLNAVHEARENVEKSTRTFADIQRKIEKQVQDDLGHSIRDSIDGLKMDVDKYEQVKKDIEQIGVKLRELSHEVTKFKGIANQIKQADFELAKHARELTKADSEKVKLMKEVDDLQRLISRMRRDRR